MSDSSQSEHFDSSGNKTGTSWHSKGTLGNKSEHFDSSGIKSGTSYHVKESTGAKSEHFDSSGVKTGISYHTQGSAGGKSEHFDSSGTRIGTSYHSKGIIENKSEHYDSLGRKTGVSYHGQSSFGSGSARHNRKPSLVENFIVFLFFIIPGHIISLIALAFTGWLRVDQWAEAHGYAFLGGLLFAFIMFLIGMKKEQAGHIGRPSTSVTTDSLSQEASKISSKTSPSFTYGSNRLGGDSNASLRHSYSHPQTNWFAYIVASILPLATTYYIADNFDYLDKAISTPIFLYMSSAAVLVSTILGMLVSGDRQAWSGIPGVLIICILGPITYFIGLIALAILIAILNMITLMQLSNIFGPIWDMGKPIGYVLMSLSIWFFSLTNIRGKVS